MSSDQAKNPYAYRGRYLLSAYNDRHQDAIDTDPCEYRPDGDMSPKPDVPTDPPELPICIIGAGMAGLYTAMILDSLGFKYQIIEGSGRVGGRLFTYHFPDEGKEKDPYDYFDVGAMRFPRTPFMRRTFDLIESKKRGLKGLKLIPFVFAAQPGTGYFFNNVHLEDGNLVKPSDPFGVEAHLTDKRLATPEGVEEAVAEILQPFRNLFMPSAKSKKDPDLGHAMELLCKRTNPFSMRTYMLLVHQMTPKDVHWCETIDGSTGLYDRALTEIIAESLAFNWPGLEGKQEWYCIDGGSDLLPKAMFDSLKDDQKNLTMFNSPVTAISREVRKVSEKKLNVEFMKVSINGEEHPQEYSAVVSTVPLPRLTLMDLTRADIHANYAQWSAIRSLQYGPAIKIGIRFTEAWWEKDPYRIHGGQTKTDLPLRTVVYPSYPDRSGGFSPSRVLIVSYCWTQDADRLGALVSRDGTAGKELVDLVFRNLATIHRTDVSHIKKYYKDKKENFFVWDWARDPFTMGAFAVFGPGVYEEQGIYSELLTPAANGRLFFAGEAASLCHGWVAGALDSAWRAVDQYLARHYPDPPTPKNHKGGPLHNPVRKQFWELWGGTEYWDEKDDKDLVKQNHRIAMENLIINFKRNDSAQEDSAHTHEETK